jgi:serine/threonine protein kinase
VAERPTVAVDPLVGRQLDEYRLEALLGKGGMARVYRAIDERLGRYAAIKVINAPLRADADYVARFEREAQAIARLTHPHIVTLYRFGEVGGLLYMAMQYVEGADLGDLLGDYRAEGAFMEPEIALRLTDEVCRALDYAHGKGVIHRDIKPSNVMLDGQGNAYLTDFGLALMAETGTKGEIFGSPHYIAPEQAISSATAVPQSDFYAVGCILYEIFTGGRVFESDDPIELAMMHISELPPPPRQKRPDLAPAVESVILKALAKEPEARYPDGAALTDALAAAIGQHDTPSRPSLTIPARVSERLSEQRLPSLPAPNARPAKRRSLPLIGILAVLALIVAAAAFLVMSGALLPVEESAPLDIEEMARLRLTQTAEIEEAIRVQLTAVAGQAAGPESGGYELVLIWGPGESFFIINRSLDALPLLPLRIADSVLAGTAWHVESLAPGECAGVWAGGDLQTPDEGCTVAGAVVAPDAIKTLRAGRFAVHYGDRLIGMCDPGESCALEVSAPE